MAEEENVEIQPVSEENEEEQPTNYKPPPEKTLQEMIETDQDDESLRKYKETLLGSSATGAVVIGESSGGKLAADCLCVSINESGGGKTTLNCT